jgi:hypothetical protein
VFWCGACFGAGLRLRLGEIELSLGSGTMVDRISILQVKRQFNRSDWQHEFFAIKMSFEWK